MTSALRVLLGCVLLCAAPALAEETGSLSGVVVDSKSQVPVFRVQVSATPSGAEGAEPIATWTDPEGRYVLRGLSPRPTRYELAFNKEGYQESTRHGFSLPFPGTAMSSQVEVTKRRVSPSRESPRIMVDSARRTAPSWTLPHLPVLVPDGTPQTVYAPPKPPEKLTGRYIVNQSRFPSISSTEGMASYFGNRWVNPTWDTGRERASPFRVTVDAGSYPKVRARLEREELPFEDSVRVESFVNAFDYGYAADARAPFRAHVEGFPSPSRPGYHVLRIGLKVPDVARTPQHRVLVVDLAESMEKEDRLALVKVLLEQLVDVLDPRDRVSLVAMGNTSRVVLDRVPATRKEELRAAFAALRAERTGNVFDSLRLAYALAAKEPMAGGLSRVVLFSDGVSNNGLTAAETSTSLVEKNLEAGVTLTSVGVSLNYLWDGLVDSLLLKGGGGDVYMERPADVRRALWSAVVAPISWVAMDVHPCADFSAKAVSYHRLVGFERFLSGRSPGWGWIDPDPRRVSAGQELTVLFEVKLREPGVRLGELRVDYIENKDPAAAESAKWTQPLEASALKPAFEYAAPETRLAYVVGAFAEKLRGSYWTRALTWSRLLDLWRGLGSKMLARPEVKELGVLIEEAGRLDEQREDPFDAVAPLETMDFDHPPTVK
ncbi:von Willebrand factor type A domain-containing protein [Myxococcaceae bacterium GXIMD 01537]